MAVDETTDDTKGVNNMGVVILTCVVCWIFAATYSVAFGKAMWDTIKRGYKPNVEDIMLFAICVYSRISLFYIAIYCYVNMKAI